MTQYAIPFNKPAIVGKELEYVHQALVSGHISGDGNFTRLCNNFLEKELHVKKALLTTSCTHALEMAAILLNIQPGDEVIVPSFTFVSTINAFVLRGAIPRFVDIRPDTLNLDVSRLEEVISPKTRVIIPVHYAGIGCEMDTIIEIAARHQIAVVEDNAHGLFGEYRGKLLGTFGSLATQSFHETKNFTCGEGGALLINDAALIERAEIIREKGTNRSRFFRGQVDKYTWVDFGSSYLPSDLLAAYLYAQFEEKDKIQIRRQFIWETYQNNLSVWAGRNGVRQPVIPTDCMQPYHMYYLLLPSLQYREALIEYLKEKGVLAVFHYLPLHLSRMGRAFGGKPGDCPVTEDVSDRLLRLPFYFDLTSEDLQCVIDAILSFQYL